MEVGISLAELAPMALAAGKGGGYAMAYPTKGDTRLDDPDITHLSIGWAEPSGREVGREGRGFPEFLVVLNWYDLQP